MCSDVTGPASRTGVYGSCTYNLALTHTVRLALEMSLGMQQFAIDGTQLQFHNVSTVGGQPSLAGAQRNGGRVVVQLLFRLGLSAAQLLGNQLDIAYSPTSQTVYSNRLERHYFGTAGVRALSGAGGSSL